MQCSNCSDEALYVYDPRGALPAYFCSAHVPSFLAKAARSGQLKTTDRFDSMRASVLESMRPQEEVVEQPTAEEPAEKPEEESSPTPKRRNRRKSAETANEAEIAEEQDAAEADSEF